MGEWWSTVAESWDAFADWADWGTLPDWLAAIATPIAVVALLVEVVRSRSERRAAVAEEARAEREQQVRSVTAWAQAVRQGPESVYSTVTAHVDNASALAIYDVDIALVSSRPDLTLERRRVRVIPPGARDDGETWTAVRLEPEDTVDVLLRFTDAQGLRWTRQGAAFGLLNGADSTTP